MEGITPELAEWHGSGGHGRGVKASKLSGGRGLRWVWRPRPLAHAQEQAEWRPAEGMEPGKLALPIAACKLSPTYLVFSIRPGVNAAAACFELVTPVRLLGRQVTSTQGWGKTATGMLSEESSHQLAQAWRCIQRSW